MRVHRQLITGMTGLSLLKLTYERLLTCRVQSSRYGTGRSTEALVGQELLERATEGIGSQGARHPHDNWYYRYARDTTARNVKDRIQESFSTKVILFFHAGSLSETIAIQQRRLPQQIFTVTFIQLVSIYSLRCGNGMPFIMWLRMMDGWLRQQQFTVAIVIISKHTINGLQYSVNSTRTWWSNNVFSVL